MAEPLIDPETVGAEPKPKRERPYLTVPEAMEWLGLSRRAINDKIEAGRYVVIRDGSRVKISRGSILRDLERESEGAPPAQLL